MNANSTRNVIVESGGTQVVGHVGLHALGMFPDRLGVGEALSHAVGWSGAGIPVHDRGRVLVQAMLMLVGGGESCTDIEALAPEVRLFGSVCSDTTLYRTFTETLNGAAVDRARHAIAEVRSNVWHRIGAAGGHGAVILDLDASLVEIHSENKQGAAAHFKGGYGFHPLFCFADATGEALASELRPGNAAANDVAEGLSSFLCEVVGSCCWVEASGEADSERVECLFPALGPGAEVTSSVASNVADGKVEDLQHGVVGGEMPPGFRDFA